jgi:integrase
LIVALARFGGLRIPSELTGLTWQDVDWSRDRFAVRSPKKEGQRGHVRYVPIFAEIRPYLAAAFDEAADGAVHVIAKHRDKANLRTQFERIIRRAGFEPWTRLFHNLRASCESDLATRFPAHYVSEWLGHSPQVALAHYLSVPPDAYTAAAGDGSAAKALHEPSKSAAKALHRLSLPASAEVLETATGLDQTRFSQEISDDRSSPTRTRT